MLVDTGCLQMRSADDWAEIVGSRVTPAQESRLVEAVSQIVAVSGAPIERLLRLARRTLRVKGVFISLLDSSHQMIVAASGIELTPELRRMPISQSLCRHVVAGVAPLIVQDTEAAAQSKGLGLLQKHGFGAYLGVPLTLAPGITIGALCVVEETPRLWKTSEAEMLADFAESLTSEIDLLSRCEFGASLTTRAEGVPAFDNDLGASITTFESDALMLYEERERFLAGDGDRLRILVAQTTIDQDERFWEVIESLGYDVDCVSGIAATVDAIADGKYDMVFVDICEPCSQGLAAAAAIRDIGNAKGDIPIVALASNGCRGSIEACRKSGVDALLTVPVSPHSLAETVEAFTRG